eukprot:761407-Pyramimonas_sp.AAC.1
MSGRSGMYYRQKACGRDRLFSVTLAGAGVTGRESSGALVPNIEMCERGLLPELGPTTYSDSAFLTGAMMSFSMLQMRCRAVVPDSNRKNIIRRASLEYLDART